MWSLLCRRNPCGVASVSGELGRIEGSRPQPPSLCFYYCPRRDVRNFMQSLCFGRPVIEPNPQLLLSSSPLPQSPSQFC